MGHAIEAMARERGHEVVLRLDRDDPWPDSLGADVAIEFSTPATAADNLRRCLERGVATVGGTTGWYARYDEVCTLCRQRGGRLLTATNFSVGMNIMFALNRRLAELMRGQSAYSVAIEEVHHVHKLGAPSGTAVTLQEQIAECGHRSADEVPITSVREGEVPGTHTVQYSSAIDTITLRHEAHSRQGLAQGALLAAEWLVKAPEGVFSMEDVLR